MKYILSIRHDGGRVAVVGSPCVATVEAAIKLAGLSSVAAREVRALVSIRRFAEGVVPAGGFYDHSSGAVVCAGAVDEVLE